MIDSEAPKAGEITTRWVATQWSDAQERRLAALLFGPTPNTAAEDDS